MAKSRVQYILLDEVVRDLLITEGKDGEHEYMRYAQLAINGLKELSFDVLQEIRTANLTIDGNTHSVELPMDYINYTKIGVCKDGRIDWMAEDRTMCLPNKYQYEERALGNESAPSTGDETVDDETNPPTYKSLGRNYGKGGGQNRNGYYRIDKENGVIYFSSNVSGDIHLEYISDGSVMVPVEKSSGGNTITTINEDGETVVTTSHEHVGWINQTKYVVHTFAVEALKAYIYWQSIQRRRGIALNERLIAKKEYYNQKRMAKSRMMAFTKEEALNVSRKGFKQSPKH